jgi:excisionase family DNA binding protein
VTYVTGNGAGKETPPPQGEGWWKSEVGEDRTDRSGPYQSRVPVREAAEALGISEGAVRMRVKRGTLPSTREGRRLYVLLETERAVVRNGVSMPGFTAEAALEPRNVSYRTVGGANRIRTVCSRMAMGSSPTPRRPA